MLNLSFKGVIGLGDANKASANIKSALVKLLPKLIHKELTNNQKYDYSVAAFVLAACTRSGLQDFLGKSTVGLEPPVPAVIDLFLEEEAQHLGMLEEFVGKPITLQVDNLFVQEHYDIILT